MCTHNYGDTVSFPPPCSFNILSSCEQKSYQWVSKFLHVFASESGYYPCCSLQLVIQNIKLRFFAEFYAKVTKKADTLKKLLQKDVINLETLLCPKVENLKLYRDIPACEFHVGSCLKRQRSRICATKKAKFFLPDTRGQTVLRKLKNTFPS